MVIAHSLILAVFAASVACELTNERYVVMLEKGASDFDIELIIQKVEQHAMSSRDELFIYFENVLLPYFYGNFSQETVQMISGLKKVVMIERDQVVTIDDTVNELDEDITHQVEVDSICGPSTDRYNLDILDDRECINGVFNPPNYGAGVDIYIVDTGINVNHKDFKKCDGTAGSRASPLYDYQGGDGYDCNGHGTHCAGIAAGIYSGVAKEANLFNIRVMSCRGSGSYTGIMRGLSAGKRSHDSRKTRNGFVGSIFSMSIGGETFAPLNLLVNQTVLQGVNVVTASGNSAKDACNVSPGGSGGNINVGSHGYIPNGCKKLMSSFSNYGRCDTIMAPGNNILSAKHSSNTGFTKKSGTSMACPHVAGLAAIFLKQRPSSTTNSIKGAIMTFEIKDITASKWCNSNGISRTGRAHLYP